MTDSHSRDPPGFESPFATVSKLGHVRSLHDASVRSAVYMNTWLSIDSGGNMSDLTLRAIAAWRERIRVGVGMNRSARGGEV